MTSVLSVLEAPLELLLDFEKSIALGSVISISPNILLVKESHRKAHHKLPSDLWNTGSVIDRSLGIQCEQLKWLPLTAKVTSNY
jgi:hypothetical protein